MQDYSEIHTFVICAYKESRFLEECILSLQQQSVKSNIIMVTSTPNDFIEKMANKYKIPLYVNKGEAGIVQDWNYAYSMAGTKYVTIAHQDDLYMLEYAESSIRALSEKSNSLIYFTDYYEMRDGRAVKKNRLLRIKRFMLSPLKIKGFQANRFVRRRILSLGSPICCPSVTFVKENLPNQIFKPGFRSDEDWEAWEMLSRLEGRFIYDKIPRMYHRIHRESETTQILGDNLRGKEDYQMFCKFWPSPIAAILAKLYAGSEKSNDLH